MYKWLSGYRSSPKLSPRKVRRPEAIMKRIRDEMREELIEEMKEKNKDEMREEIRKLKDAWCLERTKMNQEMSDRDQENEDLRKRLRKVTNWDNLNHVSDEDIFNNNPNDETASFISDTDSLQRLIKDQSNNIKEKVKKHGVTIESPINDYKVYDRYERRSMFEPIPIRESKAYFSDRMLDRGEFETKFRERQLKQERTRVRSDFIEEINPCSSKLNVTYSRKSPITKKEVPSNPRFLNPNLSKTTQVFARQSPFPHREEIYEEKLDVKRQDAKGEWYVQRPPSQHRNDRRFEHNPVQTRRFKPDKYLISRVKEFSGEKGENLENFFYTIERYFKNDKVPEENKVDIASDHLIKNALETYKLASQDHELTWPELKDILKINFQASDHQASLRRELKTLRQTENVCDYIYEFEKLMNQINGMSELDKASNFITGLQDNIAAYVTLFDKGDTLIEAKQEALRVENAFKQSNRNINNNFHPIQNDNRGNLESKFFDYRGNSDKFFNKAHVPNSSEMEASHEKNDQVLAKNNHEREITDKKFSQQRTQNDYQQKPVHELKQNLCFRCNEPYFPGHRNVCSKRDGNKNAYQTSANINVIEEIKEPGEYHEILVNVTKSLLKCQIWIGDIPLECVIDSGATKSIISTHTVNRHRIPLSSELETQVSLANGVKVPAKVTRPLSVCIQNRYCKMSFLVLPHDNIEVIIGLDLLTHMRATLDLATHVLKFPAESLRLKEDKIGSVEHDIAYEITQKKLLEIRANEIKELVENKQPQARDTVKRKQENQKQVQDKRHPVRIESLPKGTKVAIRALKLQGKINSKYIGIHTIDAQTKHGNFYLKNAKGERLIQAYPIDRLKTVSSKPEPTPDAAVTDVVIDASYRHGMWKYLLKWPQSENKQDTWLAEKDFTSTQLIEEYWNRENKTETGIVDQQAVPEFMVNLCVETSKERNKINSSKKFKLKFLTNILATLTMLLLVVKTSASLIIKDNFKFCETQNNTATWDLPESCRIQYKVKKSENFHYYSLSQLTQKCSGSGWFCAKTENEVRTYKNFIRNGVDNMTHITRKDQPVLPNVMDFNK
jgi:hypothetical protein